MKSSASSKLSVWRKPSGGRSSVGWPSPDIVFFDFQCEEKRRLNDATKHSRPAPFFVFRRRSSTRVGICWNLHVSDKERRDGTIPSSSTTFGGAVRFRRTIAVAMETVTSSWIWLCHVSLTSSYLSHRDKCKISFSLCIYAKDDRCESSLLEQIRHFCFRFGRNWSFEFRRKQRMFVCWKI